MKFFRNVAAGLQLYRLVTFHRFGRFIPAEGASINVNGK